MCAATAVVSTATCIVTQSTVGTYLRRRRISYQPSITLHQAALHIKSHAKATVSNCILQKITRHYTSCSAMSLSVDQKLRGAVLLTGGIGFLGSVCLEQLLARTQVTSVYLLVRAKKNLSAEERVKKLLCGSLFHQLHQQAAKEANYNVFAKVRVAEGDLEQPGLGLSLDDRKKLLTDIDVIVHSAANLELDAQIQDALRSNYCGTRHLLDLAAGMHHLRSFVFLSTYFVNNFKPYNTPVPEEVHYPTLQLPGEAQVLTHAELVQLLLSMPPSVADKEVAGILARLNFTSTYAFSKLLTEQMVNDPQELPQVAKVIVRPSLIANMAGAPYPGYISGFAGVPGYCIAYGMGLFHSIESVAFASDAIIDMIPVDITASLVIVAAAAAAAHGPYSGGRAQVYHATSASSYPERIPAFFDTLHGFWMANPPPKKLPFARYPTYSGRHLPTEEGLARGARVTAAKVWAASKLLQLSGRPHHARRLQIGYKALCVQNSLRYARSIVSCVANVRELQQSLDAAGQETWQCIWEQQAGADWGDYAAVSLAGLRALALKLPPAAASSGGGTPTFKVLPGLTNTAQMTQWMSAARHPADAHECGIAKLPTAVASGQPVHSVAVDGCCTECTAESESLGSSTVHNSSSNNSSSGCSCCCKDSIDHSDDSDRSDRGSAGAGVTTTASGLEVLPADCRLGSTR